MTDAKLIQNKLLEMARIQLDGETRFVDELAELFETSTDSAYRRIRLEKLMTLEELVKLCSHFDLSFDEILDSSNTRISFQYYPITEHDFTFIDYLEYVERTSARIAQAEKKELFYLANDIPIFHLMNAPILASFKLFFWQKTILNFESMKDKKFKLYEKDERVNKTSRKMRENYYRIPSTEIYCAETIDITIKQINYYFEAGLFENEKDALLLCDRFSHLVEHLRRQCEAGFKFRMESIEVEKNAFTPAYSVYYNEVLYTDTTILAAHDDQRWSYTNNNGLNIMSTRDVHFFEQQRNTFDLLKRKSTLISGQSEKERNAIFKTYQRKIDQLKVKLSTAIDSED